MSGQVIKNRKARYNYELLDTYTAGLSLKGTEVKSLREGKLSFVDSFCYFSNGELWVKSLHIAEYEQGNINNHDPVRDRKLLLKKRELNKIEKKKNEKGLTIVPTKVFFSDRGLAKMEIALARGKKTFDKRDSIKDKDVKRQMDRGHR